MGLIGNLPAVSKDNSYRENIEDAYFKIEGVNIDTNAEKVRIQVRGWLSEYARQNQGIGIFKRVFYAPITDFEGVLCEKEALLTKAYAYLKGTSAFSDTTDSLEEYTGDIDITPEIAEEQEKELEQLINELKS